MREFIVNLVSTYESNLEISLFSIWHILFFVIIMAVSFSLAFYLKNKTDDLKVKVLNIVAIVAISLYVLDFFIMPLYRDTMDTDKLPFHFCTLTSILACFVQFNKKFNFMREPVTMLAVVTPLMYLVYPGSAIGDIPPFCYKVLQTFIFHGAVFTWGFLSITTKQTELDIKRGWKSLVLIVVIIIWAFFGNITYSTSEHSYDWCFIMGGLFAFIPNEIMFLAVIVAVFAMVNIIYGIYYATIKIMKNIQAKKTNN